MRYKYRRLGESSRGQNIAVNNCLIDWYSKKQNTVETSTYGSEFCAARTATEQILVQYPRK